VSAVRRAAVGDATGVARIQVRAWHHAFADLVLPELTPTVQEQTERWTLALTDPQVQVLVAEVAGEMRGFAAFGPARDADVEGLGELYAYYVDPAAQGAGIGALLFVEMEGALRFAGFDEIVLWTPEGGLARELYERRGYVQDRETEPGHGVLELPEVRYRGRISV